MIRAILLIASPSRAWSHIQASGRGVWFVLFLSLMPLLVVTSAVEGWGLVEFGKWRGAIPHLKKFTVGEAAVFEIGQLLISLIVVFAGAILVKALGETFHGRHTFRQTFTVVAYGLAPMFLVRMLDAFAAISPWIPWGIGILLSAAVLYHGLPRIMQPDPPHAFGLFVMTTIMLVLTSGLGRLVTAYYLRGKFPQLEESLSDLAGRLPF